MGFKYEFIARPGSNPTDIKIGIEGHSELERMNYDCLIVRTPVGDLVDSGLECYYKDDPLEKIGCEFSVSKNNSISYSIHEFDSHRTLVIDPLVYVTNITNTGYSYGNDMVIAGDGNIFITGFSSSGFPTTPGTFQTTFNGVYDAYVCKLRSSNGSIIFSTYIGGAGQDSGSAIFPGEDGAIYVTGITNSSDFPVVNGTNQTTVSGHLDTFICKLTNEGTTLVYSTLFGGSMDDISSGITVSVGGEAYVVGRTSSPDLQTTDRAIQTEYGGGEFDTFVLGLNKSGGPLQFSTYIGHNGSDRGNGIDLDAIGAIFITGVTGSKSFPVTKDAFQTEYSGNAFAEAFITRISPDGRTLLYSSLLGHRGTEYGRDLKIDMDGNVIVTGHTSSFGFPTTGKSYQPGYGGGDYDVFITKFSPNGSSVIFSTFFGGIASDQPGALSVDEDGNIVVVGRTSSKDLPTTRGAINRSLTDQLDAFLCILDGNGTKLIFSSYLGWSESDYGSAVDTDGDANVYVFGTRWNYPTSTSFIVKMFIDLIPPNADAGPDIVIDQHQSVSLNGSSSVDNDAIEAWTWQFVYDRRVVILTGPTQVYIFDIAGTYKVTLNVTDRSDNWDTDSLSITVRDTTPPIADAGEDIVISLGTVVRFDGQGSHDNVGIVNWTWSILDGDGTTQLYGPHPSFYCGRIGDLDVILNVTDAAGNWGTDMVLLSVIDAVFPIADGGPDITIDQHETAMLSGNGSTDNVGIHRFTWSFEYDGEHVVLEGRIASFRFDVAGIYQVSLAVEDLQGNRASDEVIVTVNDITPPVPDAGPDITLDQHQATHLNGTNSWDNVGIKSWTWTFRYNGSTVILECSDEHFTFDIAGRYNVSLVVSDASGNTASDILVIHVTDTSPPFARAGEDMIIDQGVEVVLDASASHDNVGVVTWEWLFEYCDGTVTLNGEIQSFTFWTPGTYNVALTVMDAKGNTANDSMLIAVRDITPPIARADFNSRVVSGTSVVFKGSLSSDDVGIERFEWNFYYNDTRVSIDGPIHQFTFHITGEYEIILKVTDGAGNNDSVAKTLVVLAPSVDGGPDHEPDVTNGGGVIHWKVALVIMLAFLLTLMLLFLERMKQTGEESDE